MVGMREVVDVHIPDHLPLTQFLIQARRPTTGYAQHILNAAWTAPSAKARR